MKIVLESVLPRVVALSLLLSACSPQQDGGDSSTSVGTSSADRAAPPASRSHALLADGAPRDFLCVQRTATSVPGSGGALFVVLGDITRGQVVALVRTADDEALLPRTSFAPGDSHTFRYRDDTYRLHLACLHNYVVGNDKAEFRLTAEAAPAAPPAIAAAPTAASEIERLLDLVAKADVLFIRNDAPHDAAAAAEHLRRKLRQLDPPPTSVDDFIDRAGTRSSLSGKPYEIQLPDGTRLPAADWLRARAAEIVGTERKPTAK